MTEKRKSAFVIGEKNGKEYFIEEVAIAQLLDANWLFANSRPYLDDGRTQPATIVLFVGASDVFHWGFADGEEITMKQLRGLYMLWYSGEKFGRIIWLCRKRNMRPQPPVADGMKEQGYWPADFDKLKPNPAEEKDDTTLLN